MRRALPALFLLSCGKAEDSAPADPPGVCAQSTVTWESFAAGWIETWCVGCHSASVSGDDRYGAPEGLNFDSYDEVVAVASLIEILAAGEVNYAMPPEGNTRAIDRELLREWIACGTPGESEPAGGCAAAVDHPEDVALAAQAEADALCAGGPVWLGGDLEVSGAVQADCVCGVSGQVSVSGSLTAPELGSVGGLAISAGGQVTLAGLEAVDGALTFEGSGETELALPELRAVGSSVRVAGNPSLQGVDLRRLATVGGSLVFEGNPVLVDLDQTLALSRVDGEVRVVDNDGLLTLNMCRFAVSAGAVEVSGNGSLVGLGGFELLAAAQGVSIHDNPSLQLIDAFDSMVALDGPLSIRDNALLAGIRGFSNLEEVSGDLSIAGNPMLPAAEVQAFADGLTVGGAIDLSANGP